MGKVNTIHILYCFDKYATQTLATTIRAKWMAYYKIAVWSSVSIRPARTLSDALANGRMVHSGQADLSTALK
jgi:hypothetical protein